jgi:hypothetical protein
LHLVLRLRGGAKKRKKKTYNVRARPPTSCIRSQLSSSLDSQEDQA